MSVIFLNGCTSSGKSSLARELQKRLTVPHLRLGIDDAFAMLPLHLHNNPEGFFFDKDSEGEVRLNFGAFGLATLKAHHRSAAAIAHSSVGLVLDEVILTPDLRADWMSVLAGCDVLFVGMHCELAELERREIARGDRIRGQARGQFNIVHKGMAYDVEVDTTDMSPAAAAEVILEAYRQKRSGGALSKMISQTRQHSG